MSVRVPPWLLASSTVTPSVSNTALQTSSSNAGGSFLVYTKDTIFFL
jgi:hypothetical protein